MSQQWPIAPRQEIPHFWNSTEQMGHSTAGLQRSLPVKCIRYVGAFATNSLVGLAIAVVRSVQNSQSEGRRDDACRVQENRSSKPCHTTWTYARNVWMEPLG